MKRDTHHLTWFGLGMLLLTCGTLAVGAGSELASFSAGDFAFGSELPENTRVTTEGEGALLVEHTGAETVFVPLFQVDQPEAENCPVWYRARVASKDLQGRAYLEMWCSLGGGEYFSKGLNDPITGTIPYAEKSTRFVLGAGQKPDKFTLGITIEGPGTVLIDGVSLARTSGKAVTGASVGIRGALFGGLCGLWGALAGFLSPRGKARGFVLGFGMLLAVSAVAELTIGIVLALTGQAMVLWYASVLCGGIGVVVIVPLWFVVRYRYQQAELRRMTAMDLT